MPTKLQNGIILLWVLIIVFVFSLIFLGLYPKLYIWSITTTKIYNTTFIDWNFYSAQEFVKKILLESAYSNFTTPNQVWAQDNLEYKFSDTNYFKVSIKDEDGKFPLNSIFSKDFLNPIAENYQKALSKLFKYAEFPNELNDIFKFWEERIKIYHAKVNLLSLEEFISFPQLQYRYIFNNKYIPLTEFVTVYSSGKININTIRKEVFLSLSDKITNKTYDLLQDVVKNSTTNGIKSVSELNQYSEFEPFYNDIKDFLTTESLYFIAEITIFYDGNIVSKKVLFRKDTKDKKVRFEKIADMPEYRLEIIPINNS